MHHLQNDPSIHPANVGSKSEVWNKANSFVRKPEASFINSNSSISSWIDGCKVGLQIYLKLGLCVYLRG